MNSKKLILKSEIRKMKLTEEEMSWSEQLQDVESSRLYFQYPYCGTIDCIPSMYNKAVVYFAKQYIKNTGGEQTSFSSLCAFIANKFGTYTGAIQRTLRGINYNTNEFIITETFGLDCITLNN